MKTRAVTAEGNAVATLTGFETVLPALRFCAVLAQHFVIQRVTATCRKSPLCRIAQNYAVLVSETDRKSRLGSGSPLRSRANDRANRHMPSTASRKAQRKWRKARLLSLAASIDRLVASVRRRRRGAGPTKILLVPVMEALTLSVAVTVWFPCVKSHA